MADLVAMGYPDETVAAAADEADLLARDLVEPGTSALSASAHMTAGSRAESVPRFKAPTA